VSDFVENYFRVDGNTSSFNSALEPTATTNGTMIDSDGSLKWRPHNIVTHPFSFTTGWGTLTQGDGVTPVITNNAGLAPDGTSTAARMQMARGSVGSPNRSALNKSFTVQAGLGFEAGIWVKSYDGSEYDIVLNLAGTTGATSVLTVDSTWRKISTVEPIAPNSSGSVSFRLGITDADTDDLTADILMWGASIKGAYDFDMVDDPDPYWAGDPQLVAVDNQSAAVYKPRRNQHIWDGSAWVKAGTLIEPQTRTTLLLNSGSLSTQSVTVSATSHTLHFTGTGSITLSGAHSATLSGTGAGEENRVRLTFTPSAGTLVVTVAGTVTNAQLEEGSTPSSYIPATGSQVARAAEQIVIPHENISWPAGDELSIHLKFLATYADDGGSFLPLYWSSGSNSIQYYIDTASGTGQVKVFQFGALGSSGVVSGASVYSSGINVPMNVASRHEASSFNIAVDGSAPTENITNTGFPDLETADLQLAYTGGSMIMQEVSLWDVGIGDAGTEDATDD